MVGEGTPERRGPLAGLRAARGPQAEGGQSGARRRAGSPHGAAGFVMSKTLKKKKHWLSKVQECAVSWAGGPRATWALRSGEVRSVAVPYLGRLRGDPGGGTCCVVSGKAPSPGDVLLEVDAQDACQRAHQPGHPGCHSPLPPAHPSARL